MTRQRSRRMPIPLILAVCLLATVASGADLRPPAVPLVACDPYFSIWSPADHLTEADTVHWTGKPHRLTGLVRIDGKPYRVMGTQPAESNVLAIHCRQTIGGQYIDAGIDAILPDTN